MNQARLFEHAITRMEQAIEKSSDTCRMAEMNEERRTLDDILKEFKKMATAEN